MGPRPDTLYSATPLLIDRVLYATAGTRRAAVALNAATGEMLWMHTEDEGARDENSPRIGAGRGLAYWAGANGVDRRVVYVTPGVPPARAIQELAGHQDLETAQRYMHLSPAAIDAAIRLLEAPTPMPTKVVPAVIASIEK
jgi:hypothetical protein